MEFCRIIKIILLAIIFNINFALADTQIWLTGDVIQVIDGDTITLLTSDKKQHRIRLAEIDAPEKGQAYASVARKALNSFIYRKEVNVLVSSLDRYNRAIGTVYLDNVNINKLMVKNGFAWAYRYFIKDHEYISLENYAKEHKLGLWKAPNPVEPYLFRKKRQ